ncbi:unnamed protein product [Auanema sp. JU1783]|nr:unnamed protein product [Auanema sp. JU1783]
MAQVYHYYMEVEETKLKFDCVVDLDRHHLIPKFLLFYAGEFLEDLKQQFREYGNIDFAIIHKDLPDEERNLIFNDFHNGSIQAIIIHGHIEHDFSTFPVVINFDLPSNIDRYIYQVRNIQPTNKIAINLVTEDELAALMEFGTENDIDFIEQPKNSNDFQRN